MKAYVQFLQVNNNILMESLGSDGVFILDKRNNLETMKCDADIRMHKLRNVNPFYVGYRIYYSNRFDNKNMQCEWIRSGVEYKF